MKRTTAVGVLAAALLFAATGAPAQQSSGAFTMLKDNIFVCVSPEAYDEAMLRARDLKGNDLAALQTELREKKQCLFVDPKMADSIMAPFAIVLQRNGTKVQVQFIVSFRDRLAMLHRLINRYVLVGWTEESNLEPRTIL